MLIHELQQKLLERAENNNLRKLIVTNGMIDFFSNDYLGLARSQELSEMIQQECESQHGNLNGSTGSRLLSGNSTYTMKVEEELSILFRAEKVLLMNSGYNANIAILSSVPKKGDTIIYDELIHASLKDGSRLSFASRFPFKHNDLEDLEGKLKKGTGNLFVVLESVYSMDGDTAPLSELVDLCEKYGAHIILDEAHSTGIFGINGNGIACDLNIEYRIFARIYTFGKGMGIHGACLAGSKILMDYLVNFSRPFIYTTALPLHSVASVKCSFDYVRKNPELARSLSEKIGNFKNNLSSKIVDSKFYIDSFSPIQVFRMPGNAEAKKIATLLQRKNMDIRAILSPTVKEGEERIRICLHTFNTQEELTLLVQSVNELI